MIIYEYEDEKDEFVEQARVYPDGDVEGQTYLADGLAEDLSEDGLDHPDGSTVSEGLKLMMLLDHRFNNGYYISSWESKDVEILKEMLGGNEDDE